MAGTKDESSALQLVLGADTTLGIIAGLTLAAVTNDKKAPQDDDEELGSGDPATEDDAAAASQRRRTVKPGSRGSGDVLLQQVSSSATSAAAKKYSVHEQRDVIRKLQERNRMLKQELAIESRDTRTLLAAEQRQRLEYLQRMNETFRKKVDAARRHVERLDELLARKEHELEALRQQQQQQPPQASSSSISTCPSPSPSLPGETNTGGGGGGGGAVLDTAASISRRVRALENRLELTLVKRNEMDSINKHLRAQIEKVRKDRVIFDGIYKKLEREQHDFQLRYNASVEELQRAMDAKEVVNQEIVRLQARAQAEQHDYELQFHALKREIEAARREAQARNLLLLSAFPPSDQDDSTRQAGTDVVGDIAATDNGGAKGATGAATLGAVATADSPLRRITALSTWRIGFDKALLSSKDSVVTKYDQVFDGIKRLTGIQDVAQIAQAILLKDEENFKRFKRVEELQREEVAMKAQVEEVTAAIEAFKAAEGIATGSTQKQQFRALAAKFQRVVATNQAFDGEFEELTTQVARIKSSIHSIHSMLVHANCSKNVDQFSQGSTHLALGAHSARDITDANVLEYLQAIETYTSSLMKESLEASPTVSSTAMAGAMASPVGHGPPTLASDPAHKLRVQVPTFGGLNGTIILPAASISTAANAEGSPRSVSPSRRSSSQRGGEATTPTPRRKHGGLELTSRKSMSQHQFTAALASGPPTDAPTSRPEAADADDAEEDERAYTYEELREFATKHLVQRREDAARQLRHSSRGNSPTNTAQS
ncbi:hypothetical protein P43SY_009734 [Pythium insidiosum]|uniref:ODAD1 central coiled coil region domain-containing protein n=1 Tax=Pythium insidiosum TaxID=114742 RepID=A0AAD5LBI6_PYTIN|nr:hypothetical protein P43SY_009734 [Pythium insidiosum]